MSYVKQYIIKARAEQVADVRQALTKLRSVVSELPGTLGVELLEDVDQTGAFVFIERWATVEDQANAGKQLPGDVMALLRSASASPPSVLNLTPV